MLEYRLIPSRQARKLRIRVKPDVVEVVLPAGRSRAEATDFLTRNLAWVSSEIERVARLRSARAIPKTRAGELSFLGETVAVEIRPVASWRGTPRVSFQGGTIRISTGPAGIARIGKTLEGWLRRQSRTRIDCAAICAETSRGSWRPRDTD